MKKSQFYILAAVLLAALLLGSSFLIKPKKQEAYDKVIEEFESEAAITVTRIIYNKGDLEKEFDNFVTDFLDYSKNKNMKIVYLLKGDFSGSKRVLVKNHYLKPIIINENITLSPGDGVFVNSRDFNITIDGTKYTTRFSGDDSTELRKYFIIEQTIDKGSKIVITR